MLLALLLAGCSGLSASERSAACGTTDWYSYGVTDGRLGVPESERQDLFADCSEQGLPIDLAAYQSGRAVGLEEYCDADTGYEVGRDGRRYRDVCTGQAELAFLQGYEQGRASRPRYRTGPSLGLGLGVGSGHTRGGIGLGFPFYSGFGPRYGYYDDYCFYNRPYCRARGWY
ncbi:MAG TPA: DUF2799 domain-containing protein [Thermohalobaculum sp.]|nr:DUF2799 domain-containing protein [Thermohalobaculum sp.]